MNKLFPIQKPWGVTTRLPTPSGAEVHIATIYKGGKSSLHCHEKMVNTFYVIRGKLRVKQELGNEVILGPSDCVTIETGNFHQFEALEDTILVECYGQVDISRSKIT